MKTVVIILGLIGVVLFILKSIVDYVKLCNMLDATDEWANRKDSDL